ncbi:MAG: DNA translocase FtsK [Candidatus Kaiserbacteria bacterium]|nr:DNA translocase FtsK [Candidatus Kaiserbacteria bacterium]
MARKKRGQPDADEYDEEEHHDRSRVKSIVVGCFCILIALFLSLAAVDAAGSLGMMAKSRLFMSPDNALPILGWSYVTAIVLFLIFGIYLITQTRHISLVRLFIGGAIAFISFALFFSASATEAAGGLVGTNLFMTLQELLGFFSYILIPIGIVGSLWTLGVFSPINVWEWATSHEWFEEEEDDDEEEDEDGEEEDEEEDDDEEDDYDGEGTYDYDNDEEEGGEEEEGQSAAAHQPDAYIAPPLSLLNAEKGHGRSENTKTQANAIRRTLRNFKVNVEVEEITVGPTFTQYAVRPAEGVRLSRITGLQQNLELALAAHPIRIEAPIPGQSLVGIEVPNTIRAMVGLRTLLESKSFTSMRESSLPLVLGKTITGSVSVKSLVKMPHVLVAGTTGSGKSVLIHNFILSLLFSYSPNDLRFIFIDPKRVELTLYKGIPHLYTAPITEPKKALQALVWIVSEMERRYELLENLGARDITSYNKKVDEQGEHLPYLVVIIDELADLMQSFPREIEGNIVRIAQKSRAVGIHLIISTQRPSVNIITGVVKANIPVRIALQVASNVDSRTILDTPGAENLIGNGDLLFSSSDSKKPVRMQSAFVTEEEVRSVAKHLLEHNGVAENLIDVTAKQDGGNGISVGGGSDDSEDNLYPEALAIVIESQKASTSLLQRKLKIGYSRAARLIDMLEEQGVIGPQVGSKAREVLVGEEETGLDQTDREDDEPENG